MHKRLLCALLFCSLAGMPKLVSAQTGAVIGTAAVMTVGGLISSLRGLVQQLEQSARTLIDQGNNALGQQQLILAGIIRGTVDQAAAAYADSLDKTFTQIGVEEQSAFTNVFEAIAQTQATVVRGGQEVQAALYKTQGAANQLINRLPLRSQFPVFYGVQVGSQLENNDQSPADIEIFGFMLTDRRLDGKRPLVAVAGRPIDSRFVSVQEDRIQVQLPDEIKQVINLKGGACRPRQTFPITLTAFYGQPRGIWPIKWHTERKIDFNANAVAESIKFEYRVSFDGVRSTETLVPQTFVIQSGSVNAGCAETTNANAVFNAPRNAVELNCTASWVSASNVKTTSQNCVPAGVTATAVGSVTGRDRECFVRDVVSWASGGLFGALVSRVVGQETLCNCPGGASAALQLSGTYKVPVTESAEILGESLGAYISREGIAANIGLPFDAAVTRRKVRVEVRRHRCDQLIDTIEINLGISPNLVVTQNSRNGLFRATLRNDQLSISQVR